MLGFWSCCALGLFIICYFISDVSGYVCSKEFHIAALNNCHSLNI